MIARTLAALVLAAAVAPACAAPRKAPVLVFDAKATDLGTKPQPGACRINITGIADRRFGKDGMGTDRPLPTETPERWISAGLDTLKSYGYTVEHSPTPVPGALNLDVGIIRSYSWFTHIRINGMVALDVTLAGQDGAAPRKFRGTGSLTNMAGADAEQVMALNYALNHTVNQMAAGLASDCAALKVAAQ